MPQPWGGYWWGGGPPGLQEKRVSDEGGENSAIPALKPRYSLWGGSGGALVEGSRVKGSHGASGSRRPPRPRPWPHRAEWPLGGGGQRVREGLGQV